MSEVNNNNKKYSHLKKTKYENSVNAEIMKSIKMNQHMCIWAVK